jgi:hypothetical protein
MIDEQQALRSGVQYLAEQDAESLLILLGYLRPDQEARIEALSRELSVSVLIPDQPYLVETDYRREIIHVEAQTVYVPMIPERIAEYGARLWMKYRMPVSSYVLLLTRRGLPARAPLLGRIVAGRVEIRSQYRLVRLWQVSARRMLAMNRESMIPFIPLMRGGAMELEDGAGRLAMVADQQRHQELGLHFVMLGGLRYIVDDLLDLVGRRGMIPLEQLKESSFYKYIIEEGRQEGLQQGQIEGLAEALRLLVKKKFPGLDVSAEIARISDVSALQNLCLDVFDATDADAFRKRLSEFINS